MQSEDLEFASEWSATALQLMAAHGIPPSPENYSIWFRYVSGKLPELNKEIDACIESGHTIDIEVTAALQDRFFSDGKLADVTLSTGAKLNTEVNQILKIIEETVGNSTALGTTVREASEGLTNQSTPNDVRRAVEAIVTASRKMEDRSVELEEHLQATKKRTR